MSVTTKVKKLNYPGQSPEPYLYLRHRKRKGKQNVNVNKMCIATTAVTSIFINILQLMMIKGHECPKSDRSSKI